MSDTSDTLVNAIKDLKGQKDALSTKKRLLDDLNVRLGAIIKAINERDDSLDDIKRVYRNFTQQVVDYSFGTAIECLYKANASINSTCNNITVKVNNAIEKIKDDRSRISSLLGSVNTQISNIDIKINEYEKALKKENDDNKE